ncbi:MAG: alkaline phosphatase family protein [Prevotellaceae bacterium]|jgi:hypothetical protein|nr:alkaline phosphatase family protein [Prevotellaceae bacterium]
MNGKILTSLLALLSLGTVQAQNASAVPRLVVGLTIDRLRTDYIEAFSELYGDKGFRRLQREGRLYKQMNFSFAAPDRASGIASIYTGAAPAMNGIVAQQWLDIHTLRPTDCTEDADYIGYYTNENASAKKLLTSTVADELKIATEGKALVYAVSPFRDAAIFAAGHLADGAFWLNDITGKWCGTSYYTEFPDWLSRYNDTQGIDSRIRDYKLEGERRNQYKRLTVSPYINDEINTVVEQMLQHTALGIDQTPDFLSITYHAGQADSYGRLDQSLGALLDLLDRKLGLHNVLLFVTATGGSDADDQKQPDYKLPGGDFYINRCAALLNMFLIATYGDGQYIEAFHDRQIYLNHKLIEQKQLDLSEVQNKCADFLIQFAGVREAYSAHRLKFGTWSPEIQELRSSYHRGRSGDLYLEIMPGWSLINETTGAYKVVRYGHIPMPVIFAGFDIRPETVYLPLETARIAPTVAYYLRIRAPNAAQAEPLTDLK